MCTKSVRRTILRKTSGFRSDRTPWYGVVLEEKSSTSKDPDDATKDIVTFHPQKMQFINSKELFDSLSESQEMLVAE